MEKGNTHKILTPFLEGIKAAGASVELVYAKRLKINPCIGDFQCWFKKPGVCIHKDDMVKLYPKIKDAEILILATPVYIPLPGEMQNFINRLCPIVEPLLKFKQGRTRARMPETAKLSKFVLVGSSGWWELENLDTVVRIAKELALDVSCEYAGAVLRPHAGELDNYTERAKEVFSAAEQAGYQLICDGHMDQSTLTKVSQPLLSEEQHREKQNRSALSVWRK